MKKFWMGALPLSMTLGLAGCGGSPGGDGTEVTRGAVTGENGFAANGFAANGFAANGFAANGFAANGFAANGFAANGFAANGFAANGFAANGFAANGLPVNALVASLLVDDPSREMFRYIVSCALPEGVTLTALSQGQTYSFPGALGVAPEWLGGACDSSCQHWVSACVLARINHLGQHVEISIRGDNPALAIEPHEEQLYSVREATYYGNLFQPQTEIYTCLPPHATSINRVCGPSLSDCPMTVAGACDDVCDEHGRHGTYRDCSGPPAAAQHGGKQPPTASFSETITVFLRP